MSEPTMLPAPIDASWPTSADVAARPTQSWRLDDLGRGWSKLAGARMSIYRSPADCETIWRAAVADCLCFGFQCFEWQAAWQATIGVAEGVAPHIVHVADCDGRTLLLLPLGIYRQSGLRVLGFLGGLPSDYNVPVIAPNLAAHITTGEFAKLLRTIVRRLPRLDVVWLRRMPETIEGVRNPLAQLRGAWHSVNAYAATLPASFAAFKDARTTNVFSDNRRKRRRLAEQGQLEFFVAATIEEALAVSRIAAHQKSQRWRKDGLPDLFAAPGYLAFNEMLTRTPMQFGRVHVAGLRLDGEVIAAHWNLIFRGRLYCLLLSYDNGRWARYSPGNLLLESDIEWCIAQPDIDIFDLTVGDDPYKLRWSDSSLRLYEHIAARSLSGAVFVAAHRARRALRSNRRLRDLVRRLKGKSRG